MGNKYPENVEKIVNDYLTRVRSHMKGVPENDRDDFIKEIDSHIYESYTDEKNGDEVGKILKVLKKFGEPADVFTKSAPKAMYKIGKEKNIPLYILIGALIAIFGLPLGFGGLGVILGILGVLLGIVVAYYAVAVGFTLGGMAGIFISIIHIVDPEFFTSLSGEADMIRIGFLEFSNPTLEGVLGIFISFVLAALGIFLLFMSKYIFRGLKTIFELSSKKLKEILKRNKKKAN